MKVHLLRSTAAVYTANAYLILGDSNRLEDVNALVDVGTDGTIVNSIGQMSTGVGKKPVARVILTHSHFDHSGGLGRVIVKFNPEVLAYSMMDGVSRLLTDGEVILLGDELFEIIHSPEHSSDSICLFSLTSGALFSGDTPLNIQSPGGTYQEGFVVFLEDLVRKGVRTIYSGHDAPNSKNPMEVIRATLRNVLASDIIARKSA